ncbi:hypothetical protein [Bifidobacterium simiarum]|uniref:hypothetical protein n=1 Tax=Bifidobacterium simiarum TaxID=2045441 RepID=UPI001BDCE1EC|nr:hypothetical protein [Bifidobacterium simiarum]
MMALAVMLCFVGVFGKVIGGVAAGTVVFALLATAQWQIEWVGFSVFPSDINDHTAIRLCCYFVLDLLGIWTWEASRIGAGPLIERIPSLLGKYRKGLNH